MRCLTQTESKNWVAGHGWPINPAKPNENVFGVSATIPKSFTQSFWFSEFLSKSFGGFESCLLLVTTWGVFPPNENMHMFYKIRETYGERRLLSEAPGHLFQKYEQADLATLIQIGILSSWGFQIHPVPSWVRGFVSHDEWFQLFSTEENNMAEAKNFLKTAEIEFEDFKTPILEFSV